MSEIITVNLPDIGEGVAEGEVIEWLKNINDQVQQDEPVVVVMTDKVTVELPSPYPGILVKQHYKPGGIAIKGKPLYAIEVAPHLVTQTSKEVKAGNLADKQSSSDIPCPIDEFKKALTKVAEATSEVHKGNSSHTHPAAERERGKVLAAPKTRRLAKEFGIDINAVEGSDHEGRVSMDDLRHHAQQSRQPTPAPGRRGKKASPPITVSTPVMRLEDDETKPIVGLRNLISEKMIESHYIVPPFSFFDQLDATRLIQLRDNLKTEAANIGIKLTYMPFFIKALSMSLLEYPHLNASVDMEANELVIHKQHHIGIAMQLPTGLMVVVLKNVERLPLFDLIKAYEALKIKAQEGKLELSDMRDSTITISNFGVLGGMWATPIINYPEVAILGLAKICKQPVIKNDEVVARSMLNLSWSFDHRVIDGEAAAQFSNHFIGLLENPARML